MSQIRVLMLGDVVGEPGKAMVGSHLASLKKEYGAHAVIVNGENSSPRGRGITLDTMRFFENMGVNMVTSGNHIWASKDIYGYFQSHTNLLRPENFPTECPGAGIGFFEVGGVTVGVLNVQGRVFMKDALDCPFKTALSALTFMRTKTSLIFVDIHAETTSEKLALAYFLDGKVTAVVGTHTHVPTADERVLPNGTAFVTDLGMAGALNSMIGMKKEPIIDHFLTQMPQKFEVEDTPPYWMTGVCITADVISGRALAIERVKRIDYDIQVRSPKTN